MTRHVMLSFLQNLTATKQNAKCDKIIDEKPIKLIDKKKFAKVLKGSKGAGLIRTKPFLRRSR